MKKVWIIIPATNIWTDEAMVSQLRKHYLDKGDAIRDVKDLTRRYSIDFYIFEMTAIVQSVVNIIELK